MAYVLDLPETRVKRCSCSTTLNDYLIDLAEHSMSLSGSETEMQDQVKARFALLRECLAQLQSSGSSKNPSVLDRARTLEIQNCLAHEAVHDFTQGDDAELFISAIRTAHADHVLSLPKAHQSAGDEVLCRAAKKCLSTDVKSAILRMNLETRSTSQLITVIEENFASKLSIFQELRKPHDVQYDSTKGLGPYFNELQEASRHSFRQVERLFRKEAAKDSAKEAGTAVKPEPASEVQEVTPPPTQPTDPPASTEIVKASELNDLYAATLGYLTVCRVYPQIAIQMTGDIDECRTAQHVFQRAKSLLDRLPKSVTSESSALAGRSFDKKPAPKSDNSNMEKSIKTLTDQISKLVNAVSAPTKDPNKDSKDNNGNRNGKWGNKGNKGKSNFSKAGVATTKADDHSQSQNAADSLFRFEN
jgi:hypothetical protein